MVKDIRLVGIPNSLIKYLGVFADKLPRYIMYENGVREQG